MPAAHNTSNFVALPANNGIYIQMPIIETSFPTPALESPELSFWAQIYP